MLAGASLDFRKAYDGIEDPEDLLRFLLGALDSRYARGWVVLIFRQLEALL